MSAVAATLRPWARAAVLLAALVLLGLSVAVLGPAVGSEIPGTETPLDPAGVLVGLAGSGAACAVLAAAVRAAGGLR